MATSFICPDFATCKMQDVCSDLITLEVDNKYFMWQRDFAMTMIKHYRDYGIPYRISKNCAHPDWQIEKNI
jgi:hypothetical protein